MIEQVKKFRDHIEVPSLSERKILQHAKIHVYHAGIAQRVSPHIERPRGKRKRMALIGIKARQRVYRLAASRRKNRRNFDVTKRSSQPARVVRLIRGFVLLVADRQFPQRVKNKTLQLILQRESVFLRQKKGILRLLVKSEASSTVRESV